MKNNKATFLNFVGAIEGWFGGALLLASVSLVLLQIVFRELRIGVAGLYEIATLCFVWSVLLIAADGVRRNIHVRVDLLLMVVPKRLANYLEIVVMALMTTVAIFLTVSGYLLIEESWILGDRTLGTVSIPMWIPQLIMPVGGLLILIACVGRLRALFRGAVSQPAENVFQI